MVKISFYKQSEGFCGPTSLRMCLSYYEVQESEENLARLIGSKPTNGCDGDRIVSAATKLSFSGSFRHDGCSIEQLREYCKSFPVIVNWTLPFIYKNQPIFDGHYSVSMDLGKKNIHLADPYIGAERIMTIGEFLQLWFDHKGHHPKTIDDFILRRAIVIKR